MMSVTPVIAVVLVLVLAVQQVEPCDPPSGRTNGCSPWWLPYSFKRIFRPQCNRHDACYACGESNGISRDRCDEIFHNNLRTRCLTDPDLRDRQDRCLRRADSMYDAVQDHGESHYESPSKNWCDEDWVSECL